MFWTTSPIRTTKFKFDPAGRFVLEKTADYN